MVIGVHPQNYNNDDLEMNRERIIIIPGTNADRWFNPMDSSSLSDRNESNFREEKPHGDDTHSLLELFLERRCTRHRAI
jgi:hypothetical protein